MSSWARFLLLTVLVIESFSSARPAILPIKPVAGPTSMPGDPPNHVSITSNMSPIALPTPSGSITHSTTLGSWLEKSASTPPAATTSIHLVPTTTNPPSTSDPIHSLTPEIFPNTPSQGSLSISATDPAPVPTPTSTNTSSESKTQPEVTKPIRHNGNGSAVTQKHLVVTKIANITPPNSFNENTESPDQSESGNLRSLITAGISAGVIVVLASVGIFIFRKWKLSPSRKFRNKLEEGKPYLQLHSRTGSRRDGGQASVFLKELHS